ncbi:MAG TPA: AAA family ATPase [Acidimicrobiales bacterium]
MRWPFVGRARELGGVRAALLGGARGVVVAGAAGVGKTRLVAEALRQAEEAGCAVVRATGTLAARDLPLGAFRALLPDHDRPGVVDDRADMLRAAAATLVAGAGDRRLVVSVDDAHHLDDTSATLVHQLAATGAAFVLATVRSREPAPDAVIALWKDGLAERLELTPLGEEGVDALLRAVLGGPVAPGAVAQLYARSQGNMLFLRELVAGALTDRTLRRDGREWVLRGPLATPGRLVEHVESRLAGLDPAERSLLELVAYGEPLHDAELDLIADADRIAGLERQGLLASRLDGRQLEVRLAHPIYGEVLRAATPPARERIIARALAEAVEAKGRLDADDVLRVAAWRLTGGGAQPRVLLDGATAARWRYDFPLAERLARAALDAQPADRTIRFQAALLAAQLAGLRGRNEQAERELAALAPTAVNDDERGAVAVARIQNSVTFAGVDDERLLDEAERTISDPGWRDQIAAERLVQVAGLSGPGTTVEAARPLLERARGVALITTCVVGGFALARAGHLDEAIATGDRGRAAHAALTRPSRWYPWWHDYTRCLALIFAGRLVEAEDLAAAMLRRARAERSAEAQTMFGMALGWTLTDRGHVETLGGHIREAVDAARSLGRPLLAGVGLAYQATTQALAGRADEAAEALVAFDALGLAPLAVTEAQLAQARAWTAAARGDLAAARAVLRAAARASGEHGDLVAQASELHGVARLGDAGDAAAVVDELEAVARRIDGDLAPARSAHVAALAAGDAEALAAVAGRFEAMGADLLAAEAAAQAAAAHRQAGDPGQAAALGRRAAALAGRCEGARTPALAPVVDRPRLTPAERATAELAAAGRTNRQIAEELNVSTRTVENRLQRAYAKLGIDRRTELGAALDPR